MKEFMLIFRNEKSDNAEATSAEQMRTVMQQWQQWIGEIARDGKYSGTNRLVSQGKTVRPGKVITDGPFIEGKEMVGGYLIVKANTIDEAVEMAKSCPNLLYGGSTEVRSVLPIEYNATSENFLGKDFCKIKTGQLI